MIKIALIGMIIVLLSMQLKNNNPEFVTYLSLAGSLLIFILGFNKLELIIETINRIQSYITINSSYVAILIKIIGITYISELSSSVCRDSGHSTVASQIELFGKLTVLAMGMPILLSLLDTIDAFLSS